METLPPGDVNIFTDYLIPAISPLAADQSPILRIMLSRCIARLAESSLLFLELFEELKNDPALELDMETNIYHMTYDASLKELQDHFQEILSVLLTDTNVTVKKGLLPDISRLCIFFGRPRASEALVSHLITYFNDSDWTLRSDFCDSIVGISTFIGPHGFNEFLLPLLIMSLTGINWLNRPPRIRCRKGVEFLGYTYRAWNDKSHQIKRARKVDRSLANPP